MDAVSGACGGMNSPAPLLIFGASRGTGLEVARLARRKGQSVYGVIRSQSAALEQLGVKTLSGNVDDAAQVADVCLQARDAGAVVSTLGGGTSDGDGTMRVIDAVRAGGIRRFILVSSLGAGDSRAYASQRLLDAIGPILEEKTRAENHLAASGLDFTIIRPGQLLDAPANHRASLREDPSLHGGIPRADLAALILECLDQPETIGRTFTAVDPGP